MKERPRVALLIETSNAYARGLLRGIHTYVREHGHWSTYLPELSRGDAPPAWLDQWKGAGIIARIENQRIADAIVKLKLPVVDVSAARAVPTIPWVETDDEEIARLAIDHLRERGFRTFAFCGDSRFAWSRLRGEAMQRAVAAQGLAIHHFKSGRSASAHKATEEESQLGEWLKQLPKPVGILACYDIRGRQLLETCRRENIAVPEEVAILGVDNDELLCMLADPPLSSIVPDTHRTGYLAAELLDRMMRGEKVRAEAHLVAPLSVVTRQSTDVLAIDDALVSQAARFIREHACDGVNVEDLMTRIPVTRRVFEARFKAVFGRTPHQEILRIQLRRVEQLLRETDLSLAQIADRAGFSHTEYMSVVFKQKMGMPPSEFRTSKRK
jgi:LacI family transcriptional regulator